MWTTRLSVAFFGKCFRTSFAYRQYARVGPETFTEKIDSKPDLSPYEDTP